MGVYVVRNRATSPEWLYRDSVYDELGSGKPSASYKRFVESGNDEDTEKFYTKNQWPAIREIRNSRKKRIYIQIGKSQVSGENIWR